MLRRLRVDRPRGIELTFGTDTSLAEAAALSALSLTSVETYVDWASVEPEENRWDWSVYDKQVAALKAARLKWVPFLIAGPAYATPTWFQNGRRSRVFRCLEHHKDSRVQSTFNPYLPQYVTRFIKEFGNRYGNSGVIESVLLGISGIYGESIYPAGPEGGWAGAQKFGAYHNHDGWWAGDTYAVEAFQAELKTTYSSIGKLNKAWGTVYKNFSDVRSFLPAKAPNDRARADFAQWYQKAMTRWAVFWVKEARAIFPKTEIYLCTGGIGEPMLGADFTAQAKAIAPFGAGIRITNEGSDYAMNFSITREVASATRFYGTFCGFEPGSRVNFIGINARIYNATTSGARQLHYYASNLFGDAYYDNRLSVQNFRANIGWLVKRKVREDAALYVPRESWELDPAAVARFYDIARLLRDILDHDLVTRLSIADGALRGYRTLVLAGTEVLEPRSARAIERWVHRGGVLVAVTRSGETPGGRLYDNARWRKALLVPAAACTDLLVPHAGYARDSAAGSATVRFVLDEHRMKNFIRKIGKGWTVFLPGLADDTGRLVCVLEQLLHNTPTYLPHVNPLAPMDGKADGRYVTATDTGVLWYNGATGAIEAP